MHKFTGSLPSTILELAGPATSDMDGPKLDYSARASNKCSHESYPDFLQPGLQSKGKGLNLFTEIMDQAFRNLFFMFRFRLGGLFFAPLGCSPIKAWMP